MPVEMPNQEAGQILATATAAVTATESRNCNCNCNLLPAPAPPPPATPPFPSAGGGQTDIIAAFNSGTGFNYTLLHLTCTRARKSVFMFVGFSSVRHNGCEWEGDIRYDTVGLNKACGFEPQFLDCCWRLTLLVTLGSLRLWLWLCYGLFAACVFTIMPGWLDTLHQANFRVI